MIECRTRAVGWLPKGGLWLFVVHLTRSVAGLAAILGQEIHGLVDCDRYSVYHKIPARRRQVCWAHLKRDFRKLGVSGGAGQRIGKRGVCLVKEVFAAWNQFREGKVTGEQLKALMAPLERRMSRLLIEGTYVEDPRVAGFCENVLGLEDGLWKFVSVEGVEPTNNFVERLVRRAVVRRKGSFGCTSEGAAVSLNVS